MDLAGIRLRGVSKMYHFDCTGIPLERGDYAVVQTERGPVVGEVVQRIDDLPPSVGKGSYTKVVRTASADDLRAHQENAKREAEAHAFCLRRIEARALPMKLVRTEILLDRSKSIFYFTADGRVDFRELVKDLAHELRSRIEMRQIGVRDEARMVGGIGPCGKEFCCASFLNEFEPITVRMAKDQNLSLNPAKLSGVCGRLMCCLLYEHEGRRRHKECGGCAPGEGDRGVPEGSSAGGGSEGAGPAGEPSP
ncbi:MAG TPA: regulatory iron-sulfur-containing complex subunit RicT [Candidatus Deferrimicrobiaceae bacterium]